MPPRCPSGRRHRRPTLMTPLQRRFMIVPFIQGQDDLQLNLELFWMDDVHPHVSMLFKLTTQLDTILQIIRSKCIPFTEPQLQEYIRTVNGIYKHNLTLMKICELISANRYSLFSSPYPCANNEINKLMNIVKNIANEYFNLKLNVIFHVGSLSQIGS